MSTITSNMLRQAEKIKPALKKVLPQKFLTSAKSRMLEQSYKSLVRQGRRPFAPGKKPYGINVIGLVQAQMGLGQSCRLLADVLEASQIPYALYNFRLPASLMSAQEHGYDSRIREDLPYGINLIHINPDEMLLMYDRLPKNCWDDSYNIAFWLWELEEIPKSWEKYFPMLDEIWTPSEFISGNLRKVTDLPVKTMPYCVTAKTDEKYDRDYFHLPKDRFLFLTMYDSNSTMERKNPMGAVNSFKKAFSPGDSRVGLVIKVNNAREEDLKILKEGLRDYDNVYYITKTLEKDQVNTLIRDCDVFVSLHRAEGFGLVMAEAMLVGTPCIATNWSSNTEFMNDDVACMVDYSFTTLKEDYPPYKKGAVWADPDVDQAAGYMKKLLEDKKYYNGLAQRAKSYISRKLGMDQALEKVKRRMAQIYEKD